MKRYSNQKKSEVWPQIKIPFLFEKQIVHQHFQNSKVNQTLLLDNYNKEKSVVYLEEQMGLPETLARYSYRQQGPCSKTWQQGMQLQQQFDEV